MSKIAKIVLMMQYEFDYRSVASANNENQSGIKPYLVSSSYISELSTMILLFSPYGDIDVESHSDGYFDFEDEEGGF
ncbi:hypothetical protein CEXT_553721 [Caerostris extrusa]|uniref:Uncharacterized protein n=1 Tax=Caerostris extrusa TaxID=172846 RepID=A0AAV4PTV7_CAEEX|nr:hypothetical protein CEXT_553721 [Caerostris extrusa]